MWSQSHHRQTFAYDTLNRLTSGPAGGSYAYGDSTHLDAVTSAGTGYTAGYDPAGDMSCRAPTGSLTCTGTATGQQMGYDQLRRLTSWSNQKTSPTSTAQYAYDGEGQRVQQVAVNSGTTTTTQYIGGLEEISTTGGITTTKKYYAAGVTNVISTNGTLSYTAADGLGSMSASLDGSGNVTADQLFAPYGTTRYTSGAMPTAKAFTGQYQDGSGLAYYNARYYDPAVGQFGSADSVQGNNRYAYVAGNPETATDPTGHDAWWSSSDIGAFTPVQSASINCGDCGGVIAIQPVRGIGSGSPITQPVTIPDSNTGDATVPCNNDSIKAKTASDACNSWYKQVSDKKTAFEADLNQQALNWGIAGIVFLIISAAAAFTSSSNLVRGVTVFLAVLNILVGSLIPLLVSNNGFSGGKFFEEFLTPIIIGANALLGILRSLGWWGGLAFEGLKLAVIGPEEAAVSVILSLVSLGAGAIGAGAWGYSSIENATLAFSKNEDAFKWCGGSATAYGSIQYPKLCSSKPTN